MNKLAFFFFILSLAGFSLASTKPPKEKQEKESGQVRIKLEELRGTNREKLIQSILNSKEWVLEADRMLDNEGRITNINSDQNFVGVNKDKASVQLRLNKTIRKKKLTEIGIDGHVTKYILQHGTIINSITQINLMIEGEVIGNMMMIVYIRPDGLASVELTTMHGEKISYLGRIKPLQESNSFMANLPR